MEKVLVVPADKVSIYLSKEVVKPTATIFKIFNDHAIFQPRELVETDYTLKQIIPYIIFRYRKTDEYFVTERLNTQTETRLHNKLSLGVGGHINPIDYKGEFTSKTNVIFNGLERELEEEVIFARPVYQNFIGVINNNEEDVSKVHIGLVFEIEIETKYGFDIREKEKMRGKFSRLVDVDSSRLEGWSKIIYTYLMKRYAKEELEKFDK